MDGSLAPPLFGGDALERDELGAMESERSAVEGDGLGSTADDGSPVGTGVTVTTGVAVGSDRTGDG